MFSLLYQLQICMHIHMPNHNIILEGQGIDCILIVMLEHIDYWSWESMVQEFLQLYLDHKRNNYSLFDEYSWEFKQRGFLRPHLRYG